MLCFKCFNKNTYTKYTHTHMKMNIKHIKNEKRMDLATAIINQQNTADKLQRLLGVKPDVIERPSVVSNKVKFSEFLKGNNMKMPKTEKIRSMYSM